MTPSTVYFYRKDSIIKWKDACSSRDISRIRGLGAISMCDPPMFVLEAKPASKSDLVCELVAISVPPGVWASNWCPDFLLSSSASSIRHPSLFVSDGPTRLPRLLISAGTAQLPCLLASAGPTWLLCLLISAGPAQLSWPHLEYRPSSSTGLPCPSGSPSVSHCSASITDFRELS